jgi:hypothetical protein
VMSRTSADARGAPRRPAVPKRRHGRRGLTRAHVRAPLTRAAELFLGRRRWARSWSCRSCRSRCRAVIAVAGRPPHCRARTQCPPAAAAPCTAGSGRRAAGTASVQRRRAWGRAGRADGHIAHSSLSSLVFRAVGRRQAQVVDSPPAHRPCAPSMVRLARCRLHAHHPRRGDVIAHTTGSSRCAHRLCCRSSPGHRRRRAPSADRQPRTRLIRLSAGQSACSLTLPWPPSAAWRRWRARATCRRLLHRLRCL